MTNSSGPSPAPGTTDGRTSDWNPRGPSARRDARATYDEVRSRCPVARRPDGAWTLFSHADVAAAALDHATFSSTVSGHLQVPNGMDGSQHTSFRAVVDRYFTPERMQALEPTIQQVAADVVAQLEVPGQIDAVQLGARFAVRAQSAWLGWPPELEDVLLAWMGDHHAATRSGDRSRTAGTAHRFDAIVRSLTQLRRDAGAGAPDDVTTELVRDHVDGRPLADEEIVSILRNWTGGDLGSMALSAVTIVMWPVV